jgi:hypothetical protein
MSDLTDCPVDFQKGVSKFGVFANAFRIVPDAGQECFLDFCIYSAQEEKAEVIARIRIHLSFLPILEGRVHSAFEDLSDKPDSTFVVKDGVLRTAQGGLIMLTTTPGEN